MIENGLIVLRRPMGARLMDATNILSLIDTALLISSSYYIFTPPDFSDSVLELAGDMTRGNESHGFGMEGLFYNL